MVFKNSKNPTDTTKMGETLNERGEKKFEKKEKKKKKKKGENPDTNFDARCGSTRGRLSNHDDDDDDIGRGRGDDAGLGGRRRGGGGFRRGVRTLSEGQKSRSRAERESVAGWDGQNCLRERLEQSETAGTERGHLKETFSTAGTRRGAANG